MIFNFNFFKDFSFICSTELYLIDCGFNIFSFQVPMKINKSTANVHIHYEKRNKQHYVYYTRATFFFHNHLDLNYKSFYFDVIFSHQYFCAILQLICQLNFFYIYSLYNLNIIQHHMIYHIQIQNYLDTK